ncbi:hypothetical protein NQ152_12315 [Microbacterium sp. zg.B48]|uniref:hypothetical protein n=1 Tax=Microbacterium sp. zg.B48 TaxID=2969408 RepID=UPI00214AC296|nr:hypothetical protein [Microbacterium sp. zg.B48]MCR2764289.1 hypothetical protein [Microbacterium sp. zg.B48]
MDRDLENASNAEDNEATRKPDGLGEDGTIPNSPDGVGVGVTGEPSTFEPEEDEQAPSE